MSIWHDLYLSSQDARKRTFTESDIEALLQDNKGNVRFAQPVPVHAELPDQPKEELWLKHHFAS